jgi:DSF synthase
VLFRAAIASRDRNQLIQYGEKCIDNLFPWHRNCDLPMTSFALVQGDALGGGFEAGAVCDRYRGRRIRTNGIPGNIVQPFPRVWAHIAFFRERLEDAPRKK